MTLLYKLTDRQFRTRAGELNETLWGEGIEHTAPGNGELCTSAYLHAYVDPVLAIMLDPIHANIGDPILWEAEGDVERRDGQLKVGCTRLRTIRQMPIPDIQAKHYVALGILCGQKLFPVPDFLSWTEDWLSGRDRTLYSAARAGDRLYNFKRFSELLTNIVICFTQCSANINQEDFTLIRQHVAVITEEAARCSSEVDLIVLTRQAMKVV